jgi:Mg2+ and Co2+ transporter CorA
MRIFLIHSSGVQELPALPAQLPPEGTLWIACAQAAFESQISDIQNTLHTLAGVPLVDLHISDLLNTQLPSRYDYTAQYDLLVFRRLTTATTQATAQQASATLTTNAAMQRSSGPPVLRRIDTRPVGFAVFDRVLLSVHPQDCAVRNAYAARLLATQASEPREDRSTPWPSSRLPTSPADLMLRIINLIVDSYLELRRELTRQLDHWQDELLKPHTRFNNWSALLDARMTLHHLDEICEDQRAAIRDWIEALEGWAPPNTPTGPKELDLLKVRSRDVLEHIERVVHHVRRLEQNTETAVQMHFSVQSNRTNDIMRTLTALTAVFLPLNLIAGIFGMNFDFIPLVHKQDGFWWAMAGMTATALALVVVFWRKRYLARSGR